MRIILAFSLLLNTTTYSQSSLDSLFNTLSNKDLEVGIILPHGVCLTCRNRTTKLNQDSIRQHTRYSEITSFYPNEIEALAKKYSKQVVVQKLYHLLSDTSRDFYANALLYELLDNRKLMNFFFSPAKETWISSGRRKEDYSRWDSIIKTITIYN